MKENRKKTESKWKGWKSESGWSILGCVIISEEEKNSTIIILFERKLSGPLHEEEKPKERECPRTLRTISGLQTLNFHCHTFPFIVKYSFTSEDNATKRC